MNVGLIFEMWDLILTTDMQDYLLAIEKNSKKIFDW